MMTTIISRCKKQVFCLQKQRRNIPAREPSYGNEVHGEQSQEICAVTSNNQVSLHQNRIVSIVHIPMNVVINRNSGIITPIKGSLR